VVSADVVSIDNVFLQHAIPWNVFVDFSFDGGLVARLSDGTRVGVVPLVGIAIGIDVSRHVL
jgi:hypothetical protein